MNYVAILAAFYFGVLCGVGVLCLVSINRPEPSEPETLPADAAGPVRATLARKGESA